MINFCRTIFKHKLHVYWLGMYVTFLFVVFDFVDKLCHLLYTLCCMLWKWKVMNNTVDSSNSIQWFQGISLKVSASQRQGGNSSFPIGLRSTNFVENVEILLPVKFCCILFSVVEKKSKMPPPIRSQMAILVFRVDWKKTNLIEDVYSLLSFKCRQIPSVVSEKKSKKFQLRSHLGFSIGMQSTNMVEDVKLLLLSM